MRNVAPTGTLQRRAFEFLQGAFFLVTLGVFAGLLSIFLTAVKLAPESSSSFGIYAFVTNALFVLGIISGLSGLALAARAFTWKTDNDLARMVGDALGRSLGDEYTFVRNVSRFHLVPRNRLGYIDAVLVGPPGALVFRILDDEGLFLNEVDRWLKADKNNEWIPAGIDPTRQCAVDIKALRTFLEARNFQDVPVYGVVVFTHEAPRVELTLKEPQVPATQVSGIQPRLQNSYFAKQRIDRETVGTLVKLLCPN